MVVFPEIAALRRNYELTEARRRRKAAEYKGRETTSRPFNLSATRPALERELRRELQLPRVEHRSRRSEKRIRNRWTPCRAPSALCALNRQRRGVLVIPGDSAVTEIVGAVHRRDLINIGPVQEIECVR
jgi:hypothetical protein